MALKGVPIIGKPKPGPVAGSMSPSQYAKHLGLGPAIAQELIAQEAAKIVDEALVYDDQKKQTNVGLMAGKAAATYLAVDLEGDKNTLNKSGEQLVTKPVTSFKQVEHLTKNEPTPHAMNIGGETKVEHPGLFSAVTGMTVTVEGGRTINLGNYESARIGVSITVPCDPHELGTAYDWASDWVSERINDAVNDAKGI